MSAGGDQSEVLQAINITTMSHKKCSEVSVINFKICQKYLHFCKFQYYGEDNITENMICGWGAGKVRKIYMQNLHALTTISIKHLRCVRMLARETLEGH